VPCIEVARADRLPIFYARHIGNTAIDNLCTDNDIIDRAANTDGGVADMARVEDRLAIGPCNLDTRHGQYDANRRRRGTTYGYLHREILGTCP